MIQVMTPDGTVVDIKVPAGVTLERVQQHLVSGGAWPETANGGWFLNPLHVVGIREVTE